MSKNNIKRRVNLWAKKTKKRRDRQLEKLKL